jgi:hypothetical protein
MGLTAGRNLLTQFTDYSGPRRFGYLLVNCHFYGIRHILVPSPESSWSLLALWTTWFFFLYVIIAVQRFSLLNKPYILYSCPSMAPNSLMAPFQGQCHVMVKVGCKRNPYFLISFYQINSKLGVKVAYSLPLS